MQVRRLLRTTDVSLLSDCDLHPPPVSPGLMLLFSIPSAAQAPDLLHKAAGNNQQENRCPSQKVTPPWWRGSGGDNSSGISSIDPGLFAVCKPPRVCVCSPRAHF